MSLYTLVLFLHILGAIGLFVGLVLEGFVLARLRSVETVKQARFFVAATNRLKVVMIPSFAGVLLGGLYLASIVGSPATLWLAVSLGGFLVIMLVGGLVTGIRMARLNKALTATAVDFAAVRAQANSKSLIVSSGLRGGIAIGILFLMATKPDLVTSLLAVAGGAGGGLALALRPRRPRSACSFPSTLAGGAK